MVCEASYEERDRAVSIRSSRVDILLGTSAFRWGILSAVSLPLGAILGLWLRPKRKLSSCLMAFGAGALLFALTIELFGHVPHHVETHGKGAILAALIGAVTGGVLFDGLNRVLNNRGAYLRRLSNARKYIAKIRMLRAKRLADELCNIGVLSHLQPQHMAQLISRVKKSEFQQGDTIFEQGGKAGNLYFIISGKVRITRHNKGQDETEEYELGEHDTFGELAVLREAPRAADAIAATDVQVFNISKGDALHLLEISPEFQSALKKLADSRIDQLTSHFSAVKTKRWKQQVMTHLHQWSYSVSVEDIREESHGTEGSAALAIWLGILIDGIPESLVIGMLAASARGMSMAFIAGVFLANLPEAMSSAVSMKSNGMRVDKIMLMWGSICVITGIGAFFGATLIPQHPTDTVFMIVIGIESLAAGAMLTMIAETMLPEAYEQGGSIVGLSTLAGFLATLIVKVL